MHFGKRISSTGRICALHKQRKPLFFKDFNVISEKLVDSENKSIDFRSGLYSFKG